jgi:acyl carrier protein
MSQRSNEPHAETLSRTEVLTCVCTELARLDPLALRQVRPDSDLASELSIDSLDAVTIVLALNSRFEVDLPNMTLDTLRTPEQITDAIIALTEAKERLCVCTGGLAVDTTT